MVLNPESFEPVWAKTGVTASSSTAKTRNNILVRIVDLPFYKFPSRRWFHSVLGDRRLTLGGNHAISIFVRSSKTHVDHREQSKNISLHEGNENVKAHEDGRNHQPGKTRETVGY